MSRVVVERTNRLRKAFDRLRADSLPLTYDGRWVAELSAKRPGISDPLQVAANGTHVFYLADIVALHESFVAHLPGTRVLALQEGRLGSRAEICGRALPTQAISLTEPRLSMVRHPSSPSCLATTPQPVHAPPTDPAAQLTPTACGGSTGRVHPMTEESPRAQDPGGRCRPGPGPRGAAGGVRIRSARPRGDAGAAGAGAGSALP